MAVKRCFILVGIMFFLAVINYTAGAQECQVLNKIDNGMYEIKIGDETLYTVPRKIQENALAKKMELENAIKEIERLKASNARLEAIVEDFKKYREQCEITLKGKDDLITEYKGLVDSYKSLSKNYEKLKAPILTAEVGVGITGKDTQPALIAGLGFKKIRLFGFFQKQNAGVMVGLGVPLL